MPDATTPARRTGGRSARVQDAVEAAALELLLDVGYSGLTMRAVAQAAGVAETTIYRRWPTVDHLTAAALLRLAAVDNPIPDTGSIEGDLHALLTQIVALLNRPRVLRVVRSAAALDDDSTGSIRAARSAFFDHRFATATSIVERAIGRHELPADTDAYQLIEAISAPAYMRALLGNRPIDDDFIAATVAYALAGARAGTRDDTLGNSWDGSR
ncbi:TetR/AcrR family transcriptional regulator [Gordonia asplenii]|uniref:TetR/AcrR family transcriptional regulator n=1 Tax=Gordonia asplenii TaxID=2725283 RepID=UPI0028AAE2FA|nr:TetR/AcrR family transcriptional regulator [Gordonia asplenii]